jgi:uncharacterized Zn finger protein
MAGYYVERGDYGWGDFRPYIPVAVRRAEGLRKASAFKGKGEKLDPVKIEGRAIAKRFWGQAWCKHIESYSDFANRLPRGRTYARNGSVIDLQVDPGMVRALVTGSDLYTVRVDVAGLETKPWKALAGRCAGKIDSAVELLSGELSSAVMEMLCDRETGIFPSSRQLSMECSCPDYAALCKHLAAVLYGIGSRFDREPELLFVLRGVDKMDLVEAAGAGALLGATKSGSDELDAGSLAEVFGIELEGNGVGEGPKNKRKRAQVKKKRVQAKKARRVRARHR